MIPYQRFLPLSLLLLGGGLNAQDLGITYVTDSTNDTVFRLEDLNDDGDYNDPGEVVNYYDDSVGSISLSNNVGIAVDADGTVFVCDSSADIVMALEDTDDNGTCNELTDHRVFFDGNLGGNAAGIEMASALNLIVSPSGRVWVAVSNTSSGVDQLIWLDDLNNDGDANDAGEAFSYFEPLTGGSTGDTIVQDVVLGQDGNFYYLETGSTGFHAKGVYKLVDTNSDGMIDPNTEVSAFFVPPALSGSPFFWGFTQGADGAFYMADTGNDVIWRFRDSDLSGSIDNGTEAVTWWTAPSSSLIWQVVSFGDGSLYCAESQAPDRLLRMIDLDTNGTIDPVTEVFEIYDDTISSVEIGNPRGLCVSESSEIGEAYCFGDGSGIACPCGNSGGAGSGCANSTGSGAILMASGNASPSQDSLILEASACPANRPGLFFQGTIQVNNGDGLVFGDGLRCAGGSIVRLEIVTTDGSGLASSSVSISAVGAVSVGDTRTYQFWYRDPVMSPCGTDFNTTNGFEITWN